MPPLGRRVETREAGTGGPGRPYSSNTVDSKSGMETPDERTAMARLQGAEGTGPVADLIRQRRGGDLRPLDELLLLSPPLAEGWSVLLGAIRGQLELDSSLRELVILRIAVLNGADYEWRAHEPVARRCGLTDAKLAAIRDKAGGSALDPLERAVLAYTDAMTRDVT